MKKQIIIGIVLLIVGFFIGLKQGPEKIEISEKYNEQKEVIKNLQSKIKNLTEENLKENVKTVTVIKPDGTKTVTKNRTTEKKTNSVILSEKVNKEKSNTSIEKLKNTKTTYHSNHNALGIRPSYQFNSNKIRAETYLKAGLKCFIFECYVEGAYDFPTKGIKASVGIEFRF